MTGTASPLRPRVLLALFLLIGITARPAHAADLLELRVTPAAETMAVASTRSHHATAIFSDGTSADVTALSSWASSAPAVATVDAQGVVTGISEGQAVITATYDGVSRGASVAVRGVDGFLFTSAWGVPEGVRGFHADLTSGAVSQSDAQATGSSPWGVAADASGRFVYVANRAASTVTAFRINPPSGTLTFVATYPTGGAWTTAVMVEPLGRFLFVANSIGNSIAAFAIDQLTGALTPVAGSPFDVPGVEALAADPSGNFLFMSTAADHRIASYRIGTGGELTAVPGSPFWFNNFAASNNLLGMAVHRSGRYLFVSDNSSRSAFVFAIDPATGALMGQLTRTLDLYLSRGVVAHPNGQHVIFAGFDGIHVLAFDAAAATLTPIAGSPFASSYVPQALALDHTGQFLYGVNGDQSSGGNDFSHISVHVVNSATGRVTRVATPDSGAAAMGLAFAPSTTPGPTVSALEIAPADGTTETTVFGITRTFTGAAVYSDGRQGPLLGGTWSTDDPAVATIDPVSGVATLRGYGTAAISVARSGLTATTNHTVQAAPLLSVHVAPTQPIVLLGRSRALRGIALYADQRTADITAAATWTSSSPSIATVVAGVVFGAGSGTATVTATYAGMSSSTTVVVKSATVVAYNVGGTQLVARTRSAGAAPLTAVPGSPFTAGSFLWHVTLDPSGRFLYTIDLATGVIDAYQVDGSSGELLPVPGSPFTAGSSPRAMAVDPTGRFAYVVNAGGPNYVSAFAIDQANGALMPTTVNVSAPGAKSITVEAGGRFVYVGADTGGGVTDDVYAYRIDQVTGALTQVGSFPAARFVDALTSDPGGRFLYVAAGGISAILRYAIHPVTGALTRIEPSFAQSGFPRALAFHPDGHRLYVGLGSASSVVTLAVDGVTGALSPAGDLAIIGTAPALAIEPSGEYLYAAGDQLQQFAIDAGGTLTLAGVYDGQPAGITVGLLSSSSSATLDAIAVVPSAITVYSSSPGQQRQFAAVGTYSDGSSAFLTNSATWTSSDTGAATITATGLATTIAVPAFTTITATVGARSGTAMLTTSSQPSQLLVSPLADTATVGAVRSLTATALYPEGTGQDVTAIATWTSSSPLVATVSPAGLVTALANGDVTITASYAGLVTSATLRIRGVDANLYVSSWGVGNGVQSYHLDVAGGALSAAGGAPAGASPWGIAADPSGRFAYVANRGDGTLSAFAVAGGMMTPIGTYPTGGTWPSVVVVEPSGRFVYTGNTQGSPSIGAFAIDPSSGALTAVPGSPFAVPGVEAISAHPSGAFLYASTANDHRIAAFRIGADGALSSVAGSPFWFDAFGASNNLLGMAVHRNGRHLFVSDNSTQSAYVFGVDPVSGALTGVVSRRLNLTLSRGVVAHPNGRHVLFAGFDGIHVLAFDETAATLTPIPGSPFASSLLPQALALDHTGTYLYGVNGDQTSGANDFRHISVHTVNPSTGQVTRISTLDGGAALMGLTAIASNAAGPSLTSIEVAPSASTIQTTVFGITRTFVATATYSDGRRGPLVGGQWSSNTGSVATIDPVTGVLTVHGYGDTSVTAQRSGVSATTTLSIVPAPLVSVLVGPAHAIVAPGGTRGFFALATYGDGITIDATATAAWSASAPAVASVTGGIASGLTPGNASITASFGGFTSTGGLLVAQANVLTYAAGGSQISGFMRATGNAALTGVTGSPFALGAAPQPVALDPAGRLLFVGDGQTTKLSAFQVDGLSGALLPAPGSPYSTETVPRQLAVDPLGRFLYVATDGFDSALLAYKIDGSTGRLTRATVATQPFGARSLTVDGSGRFLYVGTATSGSNPEVYAYRIDQDTGGLTSIGTFPTGRFADDIVSDPAGRFLYVAASGENVINRYAIDIATGALTRVATDFTLSGAPHRLAFHPGGTRLYVGTNQTGLVHALSVDSVTGALTAGASIQMFDAITDLAVEPLGEYLYATTSALRQFALDAAGTPTPTVAYPIGSFPSSVTVSLAHASSAATLQSLAIVPGDITIYSALPGKQRQFAAVGTYSDGTSAFLTQSVTWNSSNPALAWIDAVGLATTVTGPGSTVITAHLGALEATATLTVSTQPSSVVLSPASDIAAPGTARPYFATAVYPDGTGEDVSATAAWTTSAPTVATVSASGVVTSVASGDATITATLNGISGTALALVRGLTAHLFTSAWRAPNQLEAFSADLATGALTASGGQPTGAAPWGVAADPSGRFVFAANRGDDTVSAFSIDGEGTLTPIGTYPAGGSWPYATVVEPRGRFLFVGNLLGNSVAAFAIDGTTGALTPVAGSPFAVPGAVALAADPTGSFLYVSTGSDHHIAAYRIGAGGALTSVAGSPFWFDRFGASNNLLGMAVHRSGRYLFVSDNSTSSAYVFGLDPTSGALTGVLDRELNLTLSQGVVAHPDGRYVFFAGFDGVHTLAFDEASGTLTPVAGSPFASLYTPQKLALDHTGRYLYGVNGDQTAGPAGAFNRLSVHLVDPVTGRVTLIGNADGGGPLMGLAIVAARTVTTVTVSANVTAADKTYDGNTTAIINTCTVAGVAAGDTVTCSAAGASFANADAGGPQTVTAAGIVLGGASASNYSLASPTATTTASIIAKSVTATVTAQDKAYDGTTAATIAACAVSGLVSGDDVTCAAASASFANAGAGGPKTVTATGIILGGASASNYSLASPTATTTASISARSVTASVTAPGKTYDGMTAATVVACSVAGVVIGDAVTCSSVAANFVDANAGGPKTVTATGITLGGASAGNYSLASTTATTTASITRAPLTVTAADATAVAGDPLPAFIATMVGFVSGETAAVLGGALQFAVASPAPAPGTHAIIPSGLTSANYAIAFVPGTLTITPGQTVYLPAGMLCGGTPGHQILPPISPIGPNVVKQGSAVPAKFRVCYADGVSVGTTGVVSSFRLVQVIDGTTVTAMNEAVLLKTREQSFRFDASGQQWIANIDTTPLTAGRTYVYQIVLRDGSTISFRLTPK